MTSLRLLIAASLILLAPLLAFGHEMRPGYLEVTEAAEAGQYEVLWKAPMRGGATLPIQPVFPPECVDRMPIFRKNLPGALLERRKLDCDEGGLFGKAITIGGLSRTVTDVLVRVTHANGSTQSALLKPDAATIVVAGESSWAQIADGYTRLGIEHILFGFDHLLFVLGLLLIVSRRSMLLKTVTSFTVAHSITLAAATLGIVRVAVPPIEAAIALSILFMGPEIVRHSRGQSSLMIRKPWLVAFAFGLLHGFGFASGLSMVGLPNGEVALALLWFNIGVELGQLAFVSAILGLALLIRVAQVSYPRWASAIPGYAVGGLGAYWTIQRSLMLFDMYPGL